MRVTPGNNNSSEKFFYLLRSTWWMRWLLPRATWKVRTSGKKIFLTFDDGPVPGVTTFVLDELKKYGAKASFFCIGENVVKNPELYQRIIGEGHAVGNHTHRHPNGWNTGTRKYLEDVAQASVHIRSFLFRPPYGRIKRSQAKGIARAMGVEHAHMIMWSLLSGDFDPARSREDCFEVIRKYGRPGSIIVFHDSLKAFPNLSYALPQTLDYFSKQGYLFEKIEPD
jgi:peptidoglycan/xylan/chitin deacetylase (PgdA/CDA1 family)